MKYLLWLLALFALAAALALGANLNDGYVLFVMPPWRIELTANFFALLFVLVFALFYVVVRAFFAFVGLPAQVAAYRERQGREKSFRLFQDAFRLLFEGRYGQALKRAKEAHDGGAAPGLAALIAARAAQRMRLPEEQDRWLTEATQIDPQIQSARWMLEAEMHLDNRQFEDALAALGHLQRAAGRHIAALRVELRARQGAGHWEDALRLARQLEKRSALPAEVAREVKVRAHQELLARKASDTRALLSYLREIPADEMHPRLARAAAEALLALDAHDEAAHVIEAQLEREWDDPLIALYGRCQGGSLSERIARAERWLLARAGDAALLLALGRLCVAWRLWGKAQSYLEASLALTPTRDAHLALASLFDGLQRTADADRHFRLAARTESAN